MAEDADGQRSPEHADLSTGPDRVPGSDRVTGSDRAPGSGDPRSDEELIRDLRADLESVKTSTAERDSPVKLAEVPEDDSGEPMEESF